MKIFRLFISDIPSFDDIRESLEKEKLILSYLQGDKIIDSKWLLGCYDSIQDKGSDELHLINGDYKNQIKEYIKDSSKHLGVLVGISIVLLLISLFLDIVPLGVIAILIPVYRFFQMGQVLLNLSKKIIVKGKQIEDYAINTGVISFKYEELRLVRSSKHIVLYFKNKDKIPRKSFILWVDIEFEQQFLTFYERIIELKNEKHNYKTNKILPS